MPPSSNKILIVDDEEDFIAILKQSLEIRGYEVITATNAVEAGMKMADRLPSIILMDIKMPGINGFQACEAIKRNPLTENVPIIITSALSDDATIKKAFKIGITDYLVKPVEIEKLLNRIKDILGNAR